MKKRGGINEYDYVPHIRGDEFKNMYYAICNHYLRKFCARLGFDYRDADWVADEPGGVACVGDLFVCLDDMRFVVDNSIPYEMFIKWYDLDLDLRTIEADIRMGEKFTCVRKIGLRSYCIGAPLPYTKEEMRKLRKKADRVIKKIVRDGEDKAGDDAGV